MKVTQLVICVFMSHICNSQGKIEKGVRFFEDSSHYFSSNKHVSFVTYEINNQSNATFFILFGIDRFPSYTDSIVVRKYFFSSKSKNASKFIEICMDHNVKHFLPNLFESFVKIIEPNENFIFQVIAENNMSTTKRKEYLQFIKRNTLILEKQRLYKILPILKSMNKIVPYKPKIVSIVESEIIEHQKETPIMEKSERRK